MIVQDGEEKNAHDRDLDELQEALENTKKKETNPVLICQKEFQKLNDDAALSCSNFFMKCFSENKNEDSLAWKVNGDIEKNSIPGACFERDAE